MTKTRTFLKTIERLNQVIEEKERVIRICEEENDELRMQLRHLTEKPPERKQPLFTYKGEG